MVTKISAVEALERAGVDVPALLTMLVDGAIGEFGAFLQLAILGQGWLGPDRQTLQQRADAAGACDRRHFDALVARIHELGGTLPEDVEEMQNLPACPSAVPSDLAGLHSILLNGKRVAVRNYTRICDMTFGRDPCTYSLVLGILDEEIGHEAWLSELQNQGSHGPFDDGETRVIPPPGRPAAAP